MNQKQLKKQIGLLKEIRALTGLSQAKFSKTHFKKSASFIQHLEDGYRQLLPWAAEKYIKIADENGKSITWKDLYG